MTNSRSFDDYLIKKMADPAYAKVYLEAALETYIVISRCSERGFINLAEIDLSF